MREVTLPEKSADVTYTVDGGRVIPTSTDGEGKLYLYLTGISDHTLGFVVNGKGYYATVSSDGTDIEVGEGYPIDIEKGNITIDANEITQNGNVIEMVDKLRITQSNNREATANTITVGENVTGLEIVLAGVYIYSSHDSIIYSQSDLTLTLEDDNYIESTALSGNVKATVYADQDLTIDGDGSLEVYNIYSNNTYGIYAKNVTINGGNVKITGNRDGITAFNNVTINGGTVEVNNSCISAGNLIINGGMVTSILTGDGKRNSIETQVLEINGGTVETRGGASKGISAGSATINGGTVMANDDGSIEAGQNLTINGGTVETSGEGGISADNVTINGGTVETSGRDGILAGNTTINGGAVLTTNIQRTNNFTMTNGDVRVNGELIANEITIGGGIVSAKKVTANEGVTQTGGVLVTTSQEIETPVNNGTLIEVNAGGDITTDTEVLCMVDNSKVPIKSSFNADNRTYYVYLSDVNAHTFDIIRKEHNKDINRYTIENKSLNSPPNVIGKSYDLKVDNVKIGEDDKSTKIYVFQTVSPTNNIIEFKNKYGVVAEEEVILDGVNISTSDREGVNGTNANMTITLVGENKVQAAYPIQSEHGKLTIGGVGSLQAIGNGGIYAYDDINITNATVTATGGIISANGCMKIKDTTEVKATGNISAGNSVTIENATVTANKLTSENAITITGGTVELTGDISAKYTVTITNATVTANNLTSTDTYIEITGGTVNVTGTDDTDGISASSIGITEGATVNVTGAKGIYANTGSITITNATITANNLTSENNYITITGGTVELTGDISAKNNTVTITGSTVELMGDISAPLDITITDATVTAKNIKTTNFGTIQITAENADTKVTANGDISTESGNITMENATVTANDIKSTSTGTIQITAENADTKVTAKGDISAGGGIMIEKVTLNANNIKSTSSGAIQITAENADTKVTVNGDISVVGGITIDGVTLNANNIKSTSNYGIIQITAENADTKVTVSGDISAGGSITMKNATVTAKNLTSTSNYIEITGGTVNVTGTDDTDCISTPYIRILDGATVNVTGTKGIDAGGMITIDKATKVTANKLTSTGNIIITGSTVEVKNNISANTSIEITGGTVVANNISCGEFSNIIINGGSVKASMSKPPINSDGVPVYLLTLTVPNVAKKDVTYTVKDYNIQGTAVADIKTKTDDENKLYLYLPIPEAISEEDKGWQQVTVKEGDQEYYKYAQISNDPTNPTSATCVTSVTTPTVTAFSVEGEYGTADVTEPTTSESGTITLHMPKDFVFEDDAKPTTTITAIRTKSEGSLKDDNLKYTLYDDKATPYVYSVVTQEYTQSAELKLKEGLEATYGMTLDEMLEDASFIVHHNLVTRAVSDIVYEYSSEKGKFVKDNDEFEIKIDDGAFDKNAKPNAGDHTLTVDGYDVTLNVEKKSIEITTVTPTNAISIPKSEYEQKKEWTELEATVADPDDKDTTINYTFTAVFPESVKFNENISIDVDDLTITDTEQKKNYELVEKDNKATVQATVRAVDITNVKLADGQKITNSGGKFDVIIEGVNFDLVDGSKEVTVSYTVDEETKTADVTAVKDDSGKTTHFTAEVELPKNTTSKDVTYEVKAEYDGLSKTVDLTVPKKSSKGGSGSSATPKPTVTPTPTESPKPTESVAPTVAPTESVAPTTQPSRNKPYISGYEENGVKLFKPDSVLTRAEVATILANISDDFDNTKSYDVTAPDVSSDAWYRNYIGFAVEKGYLVGYEDGTVRAENNITRAELAVLLARFGGIEPIEGEGAFPDMDNALWSVGYVNAMAQNGYITGYEDGMFKPQNNVTRAEVVAIVNRLTDRTTTTTITCPFADVYSSHWAYNDIIIASCE